MLNRKEHKALADSSAHSESGDSDVSFGSSAAAFGRHAGGGGAVGGAKSLFAGMLYPHAQSLPYGYPMAPLCSNNNGYGESENKMPRLELASAAMGVGANAALNGGGACSPTAANGHSQQQHSQMSQNSYLAAANNFAQLQSMSMNAAAAVALQNAATAAFLAQQHQQQPAAAAAATPAVSSAAIAQPSFCAPLASVKTSEMLQPLLGAGGGGSLSPIADGFYRHATSLSPQSLPHLQSRASAESTFTRIIHMYCTAPHFLFEMCSEHSYS